MPYELPAENVAQLYEAQRLLRDAEELCARMTRAGYNVEAQDRFCQQLKERIESVLREFGPQKRNA